ncbi:MAG: hypothetical protein HY831_00145 [Candidatus Aenigmarchaeota archaeon]|nr:hypothetical protein [Candidatus Aenigmarchaeota archaeon]
MWGYGSSQNSKNSDDFPQAGGLVLPDFSKIPGKIVLIATPIGIVASYFEKDATNPYTTASCPSEQDIKYTIHRALDVGADIELKGGDSFRYYVEVYLIPEVQKEINIQKPKK